MHYTIFIVVRKENHRFHRATVHPKFRSYPKLYDLTKLSIMKQPRDQRFIQITIIYLNRCEAVIDLYNKLTSLENVQSNLFNFNEIRRKFLAICHTNGNGQSSLIQFL